MNDYGAPPKSDTRFAVAVETFERMRDEVAAMGGRTPHELMRCVEVDFIRDCAEMAARSSLAREESRWGSTTSAWTHPNATTPPGCST